MVSQQIITPAVWTETARNLLTNPGFEASSGVTEFRRNLFKDPLAATVNNLLWRTSEGGLVAPPATVTDAAGTWMRSTRTGAGNVRLIDMLIGLGFLASTEYRIRARVRSSHAITVSVSARPTVSSSVGAVTFATPALPVGESYLDITGITGPNAPGTAAGISIVHDGTTVGATLDIREVEVELAASAYVGAPLARLLPGLSLDPDLTVAFTGAVNNSEVTMTGVAIANLTNNSGQTHCYQSSTNVVEGGKSARYTLATTAAIGINPQQVGLTLAAVHTLVLRVRPRDRTLVARPRLRATTGAVTTFPVGVWTEVRHTGTAGGGSSAQNGLLIDASSGHQIGDVVDVDAYLIAEGTYAGPWFDGSTYSTDRKRYRWLGDMNASQSVEEIMTTAEVVAPIFETVTLTSTTDEIVLRGDPTVGGFVYDNETLQRWYNMAPTDPKLSKRPNAHGAYGLGQVFTKEHRPLVSGQFFGMTSADGKAARARLTRMYSDGLPISMAVTDEEGITTRRAVWLVEYDAPFTHDFSHFTFDIEFIAPDARRYGDGYSANTGLPTDGSGLIWNLGTAPSTLFFDWGTPGNPGQVSFTNTGTAATYPRLDVGDTGGFTGGFRVTELETGRELTFERSTATGDVIILDSRTHRATLNQGDMTRFLTSRDWFEIPAGETHRYQINALGGITGAPTMTIYTAPAYL